MAKYTVRVAHLEKPSDLNVGDLVKRGKVFGRMGSSGQSTASHVHMDCIKTHVEGLYHLSDIGFESSKYTPSLKQLLYFIDNELFGVDPVVTTSFGDPEYFLLRNKIHYGFDLVPENRHNTEANYNLIWNRSGTGCVLDKGYDEKGYGYWVTIGMEC